MKLKKGDIAVLIILILAVAAWYVTDSINTAKSRSMQAVIQINGQTYKTVPIKAGMDKQNLSIKLDENKYIDIVISGEGAYVEDVTCPDKICEKTGIINKAGQSIVCLPNKVVIYIEGTSPPQVDKVSY